MLIWLESFDEYGSISAANVQSALRQKYELVDLTSFSPDGGIDDARHSGKGLHMGHVNQFLRTKSLRDVTTEEIGVVGFALKTRNGNALGTNDTFFSVLAGGELQWSLRQEGNGTWSAYRGTSFLETSPSPIVEANAGWYYIEIKFRIHDSMGTWIVKVDGTTVWTSGTYDTRVSSDFYWDRIEFAMGNLAVETLIDDLYILDGSGTANNDFLGDTVVELIQPDTDGTTTTWTPSTGTDHSALVDEAQSITSAGLSESDYIEGDTTGEKDLFDYTNLTVLDTATTIHGVQINTYRRITAEQPADLIYKTRSVATESGVTETVRQDDSAPLFVGTAIIEEDPDASAAWTPSTIDAAEFGVEVG